jgi:hypothetical protein
MTTRLTAAAIAAAALSLAAAGCTANNATAAPKHTTTARTTATASLPDPLPSALPLGTRILVQRQGSGTTTLDLTDLLGRSKKVDVRWTCTGNGGVKFTDGASKPIVWSAVCANTPEEAGSFGATIPLSKASTLRWTLNANSTTRWRIAVTTAG